MVKQRFIELLAPAKNVQSAREAIIQGSDAVYIGAPKFGARAAAGNSLEDLADLIKFAHLYYVRIYITINVLLFDEELSEVEAMIWDLWRIGADALIVQDMGITQLNLPPIPLHASTQLDNRTVQKVRFLQDAGFKQVVLARELSLEKIREIAGSTTVPLECFVHGALCVCYSGQCYLSQAMCGRSANRGECAQYCRLPCDLVDKNGKVLIRQKHLLSLKDMNRTDYLEDLIDAGISSFKIEGRLKDISYVKNVTAWYRMQLDEIIERRPDLKRRSSGYNHLVFHPDPRKSFNRGFTDYFLKNRSLNLNNPDTPKSIGEPVGCVKDIKERSLTVSGLASFANGDGLSFYDDKGHFDGFRINKVEDNRLFPVPMPHLKPGTPLYRTHDQSFERELERQSGGRYIPVTVNCWETPFGFAVSMDDNEGHRAIVAIEQLKVPAAKPQIEQVRSQLIKLGNTIFEAVSCTIEWTGEWFMPVSKWADLRRQLCEKMGMIRAMDHRREEVSFVQTSHPYPEKTLTYLGNVLNKKASEFYKMHGVTSIEPAFESRKFIKNQNCAKSFEALMSTKYCILFELGYCRKTSKNVASLNEPLFLVFNNQKIQLDFDCQVCEMHLSIHETDKSLA